MQEFVNKVIEKYPWAVWVAFALGIILLFGYLVENYWKDKIKELRESTKKVNPTINNPEGNPAEVEAPNAQPAPAMDQQQPVNLAQMVQQANPEGLQDAQQGAMPQQPMPQQMMDNQQVYQQDMNGQVMEPNMQGQIPQEVYQGQQQMYQDATQNIDPSIMQVDSSYDVSNLPVYNPTDQN